LIEGGEPVGAVIAFPRHAQIPLEIRLFVAQVLIVGADIIQSGFDFAQASRQGADGISRGIRIRCCRLGHFGQGAIFVARATAGTHADHGQNQQ
jgi:hypothetical protein